MTLQDQFLLSMLIGFCKRALHISRHIPVMGEGVFNDFYVSGMMHLSVSEKRNLNDTQERRKISQRYRTYANSSVYSHICHTVCIVKYITNRSIHHECHIMAFQM